MSGCARTFRKLVATVLPGFLVAFMLLNGLFCLYYHLPRHSANGQGTTDYAWEPGGFWIKMTEGISWGRMDGAGFNNPAVIAEPDVLVLGSSHTEATNVCARENFSYLLGVLLRERGLPLTVYNRGISGHHFLKCCKYLSANAAATRPRYVVIETSRVEYSAEDVGRLVAGRVEVTPSHGSGPVWVLQALPFLRLLYSQIQHGLVALFLPGRSTAPAPEPDGAPGTADVHDGAAYDQLFAYVAAHRVGAEVIVFYHPTGTPRADGSLAFQTDAEALRLFRSAAERHGVTFVDLTPGTRALWNDAHVPTHGFCTGPAFTGHLNRAGHRLAARELARVLCGGEGDGDAAL